MKDIPFNKIKNSLIEDIPSELVDKLPNKWEKIGDVLIITLPSILEKYKNVIGKNYAEFLKCKTVLRDIDGISGEFRVPNVEIIYGTSKTETIHKENKIRYKLDPEKIMFSSGNMGERSRMGKISNKKEIIVDLFAGIGYFTLPIAVYSKPKKIIACEKNQIAFNYLNQNIVFNDVTSIVEPRLGDNRDTAPKNIANRVIMGYFEEKEEFLTLAIDCLLEHNGIIHYHIKLPDKQVSKYSIKKISEVALSMDCKAEILNYFHIKSYAPGISHYVFDIEIGEK